VQTVRNRMLAVNADGPTGLNDRMALANRPKLDAAQ